MLRWVSSSLADRARPARAGRRRRLGRRAAAARATSWGRWASTLGPRASSRAPRVRSRRRWGRWGSTAGQVVGGEGKGHRQASVGHSAAHTHGRQGVSYVQALGACAAPGRSRATCLRRRRTVLRRGGAVLRRCRAVLRAGGRVLHSGGGSGTSGNPQSEAPHFGRHHTSRRHSRQQAAWLNMPAGWWESRRGWWESRRDW